MHGQMTAGSWIYIANQGIYETLSAVARTHFGSTLKGKLTLTAGFGGMGGAQTLAITMNDGVAIVVEVDKNRIEKRIETRYLGRWTDSLDEALKLAERAKREGNPLSIGLLGKAEDIYLEFVNRGIVPDVATDQTSDHDELNIYAPNQVPYEEALKIRAEAITDWPLLNAMFNTASGATWVSIHNGGGVGIGYSIHAGQVIVANCTD